MPKNIGMTGMSQVNIDSNGACDPIPGPGGWGAVLVYMGDTKEMSNGSKWTTNNRMELTGATVALKTLTEPCENRFHTDSTYL